ncbi:MAG: M15 family metallopeptidase [Oscillospiraceae bacterium]|nr:M15 family metallopeptidase [Oscillospiraceae bacterium]
MAKKKKQDRIIFDLTKYLFIITLLLFLGAFIISMITEPAEKKNKPAEETTASVSETISDTAETGESSSEGTAASETQSEDAVTEVPQEDIDNAWAMFLVNNNNPLPDNYDSLISTEVVFTNGDRDFSVDSRIAPYLTQMIEDAKADGIDLAVASAYRSMEYQQYNFDRSVQQRINDRGMTYDEAYADTLKEVALPGVSEHNAGLAVDILSSEYYSFDDDGFKNTKAYAWLMEHAAEYGFILRYPEGKEDITGIIYEPWHYRFVGVYYANKVKESGLCLEEYYREMGWAGSDGIAKEMKVGENRTEAVIEENSSGEINIVV